MSKALRYFQSAAKAEVYANRDRLRSEHPHQQPNILVASPTGSGKTVLAASILAEHDGPACVSAHRRELVGQLSRALADNGVRHGIIAPKATVQTIVQSHVDEFGRSFYSPTAPVRVAGVDTLIRMPPSDPWFRTVTLNATDECFPAGTLVEGRPIEEIKVGDFVTAFDEKSGAFASRKVVRLFKNVAPSHMVRVTAGHHVVTCTFGHPFWTRRGWVNAVDLTTADEVLTHELHELRQDDKRDFGIPALPNENNRSDFLHSDLRLCASGAQPAAAQRPDREQDILYGVRDSFYGGRPEADHVETNGEGLLRRGMLESVPRSRILADRSGDQSAVRFGADGVEQSDAQPRNAAQGVVVSQASGAHADDARREWSDAADSGANSLSDVCVPRLCAAVRDSDVSTEGERVPADVQAGLGAPDFANSNRGGRAEPQGFEETRPGRKERRLSEWRRLDRIEVLERPNFVRTPKSDEDGHVYNIEVEELHTYVANGVVVHNCHHVQRGNKWGRAMELFPNAWGLGLTAAPIRGDGGGLGRHASGYFDYMVEAPRMRRLIREGYLTDYRLVVAKTDDLDLSEVASGKEDYNKFQVRKAVHKSKKIVGNVVDAYLKHAAGKLGVTFAVDVEAAVEIAKAYRDRGVPAEVITADTPEDIRVDLLRKFKNREILQLVNVDLFGEGFDLPAIEVVSMARPTQSFQLFMQQFGRALRLMISPILAAAWDSYSIEQRLHFIATSGKPYAIIIDHVGNCLGNHGLPDREGIVFSLDDEVKSKGKSDATPLRYCANEDLTYITTFLARDRKITYGKALEACNGSIEDAIARGWIEPTKDYCAQPFERMRSCCPHCGWVPEPVERARPEHVDGDMYMVDPEVIREMLGEVAALERAEPPIPRGLPAPAQQRLRNVHNEVRIAQHNLRHFIQAWGAAREVLDGLTIREAQKAFYLKFGVDVLSAQALRANEAAALMAKVQESLLIDNVTIGGVNSPQ